ncbi:MarR family winged helix-turn-helix transcriptional regulator [uncultured Methanobrevibacter sp.]|uniref:MarR family winged helix-turn-helix transcriptional regulator n=1 Tax=uncultured Methanobrevibacter sp. TaxID=253161 RepID=UPI002625A910|nr:MarR family transcriptional regulator [uncultured Methanobrevibacter sp.]
MSLEEFKNTEASNLSVGKLISMIARGHAIYINHHIAEYDINSTQLHLLYEISYKDNINQEQISRRCNINKGAVARSIKKLEDKGFVIRQVDENNRRQNKVSLTPKGKETLDKAKKIIEKWENEVILEEGYIKKELLQQILKEIAVKTIELNQGKRNE